MTRSDPPPLALALMRRFLRDDEPLAGDLLEGFAARRSRLWFWRQVLAAIAIRAFHGTDPERPLGVGGDSDLAALERVRNARPARHVNLTASPLPGIGGLGLVVLGVIVAPARPEVWWMFVPAIAGGAALGVILAVVRRRAALSGPAGESRTLLKASDEADRLH
jgi:hypothetical protein